MRRARAGFTLAEVLMVMGLSMFVFIGVIALGSMMGRSSMASRRQAGAQMDAALALQLVDRQLRQATQVSRPASGSGETLEGCSNAATLPGDGTPSALDASRPMTWFAFCRAGPTVHYHAGNGCPGAYVCGSGSSMSFGREEAPASVSFTRPAAPAGQVDVSLTVAVKDQASTLRTSVAFAAPSQ